MTGSKRQKARRNVAAFKTLLSTPADAAFAMPAGATLYVPVAAEVAAGTSLLTAGSREISSQEFYDNQETPERRDGIQNVGYFEKGVTVTLAEGFSAQIDTGLGRLQTIASIPEGG